MEHSTPGFSGTERQKYYFYIVASEVKYKFKPPLSLRVDLKHY